MISTSVRILTVLVTLLSAEICLAQLQNLPRGVGGILYGYRTFIDQTQKYNGDGKLEPLAKPLQKDFTGPELLEGVGGDSLKTLATHLNRTDSFSEADNSLLSSLHLGQLDGEVNGKLSAHSFGIGFGVTKYLTLMVGTTYISADVTTEIRLRGQNNAQQIKHRLGELAFDELKQGLDQASQLTTNHIKQSIEDQGYAPIDHWSGSGMGDVTLGAIYGFKPNKISKSIKATTHITSILTLPTGYVDDPDILTDVSMGKGYYSIVNMIQQGFTIGERLLIGGEFELGLNMPTTVETRVPEFNEAIISADRKTTVDLTPGHDLNLLGSVGYKFGAFSVNTTVGRKRHFKDSYSGPIEGNYEKLAETSEKSQTYIEIGGSLSTVELFQKNTFAIPFIMSAKYHHPVTARNYIDDRYFQINFVTFFATPMASVSKNTNKKKRNRLAKKRSSRKKKSRRSLLGHH